MAMRRTGPESHSIRALTRWNEHASVVSRILLDRCCVLFCDKLLFPEASVSSLNVRCRRRRRRRPVRRSPMSWFVNGCYPISIRHPVMSMNSPKVYPD